MLCLAHMLSIYNMRSITEFWFPCFAVCPDSSAFTIHSRILIHAIIYFYIRQPLYNSSCFQITSVRILNKPELRFQIFNNFTACFNKFICFFQNLVWGPSVLAMLYCVQSGLAQTTSNSPGSNIVL